MPESPLVDAGAVVVVVEAGGIDEVVEVLPPEGPTSEDPGGTEVVLPLAGEVTFPESPLPAVVEVVAPVLPFPGRIVLDAFPEAG